MLKIIKIRGIIEKRSLALLDHFSESCAVLDSDEFCVDYLHHLLVVILLILLRKVCIPAISSILAPILPDSDEHLFDLN